MKYFHLINENTVYYIHNNLYQGLGWEIKKEHPPSDNSVPANVNIRKEKSGNGMVPQRVCTCLLTEQMN